MDLAELVSEMGNYKKGLDSVLKTLKEISRFDKDRAGNLPQLRNRLNKLQKLRSSWDPTVKPLDLLDSWMDKYRQELDGVEDQARRKFGTLLETELVKIGLGLGGHYPELKAGMFTIELDFDKKQANLWYGPKQEKLDRVRLSAAEIAKRIEKLKKQLGSELSEDQFVDKMRRACVRAADGQTGKSVPIGDVLAEMAYLCQDSRFRQDPRRENYRTYGRADFSYDLYKHRSTAAYKGLSLTVASRAYTKNRKRFLWVPDDEQGKGTTYSHIKFKEYCK